MPYAGHLWYEQSGSGLPVLFVHGWCMSSVVWELQRPAVAEQYRFLALDLHGHGRSLAPKEQRTGFSGYADDILSLVEQLELRHLIVVGWSMGAQAVLKAYPHMRERVAGLVLVGATPRFTSADHFPFGLAPKEAEGMRVKLRRNLERALIGFQHNLFVDKEFQDPADEHRIANLLSRVAMPAAVVALAGLEALMEEELLQEAQQVACPALLLHGQQDRVCLPQASAWLGQMVPGSQRIVYEECGHAPFLSRSQRFNHDLISFVEVCHGRD